jgi:hypothetical protein
VKRALPDAMGLGKVAVTVVAVATALTAWPVRNASTPAGEPETFAEVTSTIDQMHPFAEDAVMTTVSVIVEPGTQYQMLYDFGSAAADPAFNVNVAPAPVVATALGFAGVPFVV